MSPTKLSIQALVVLVLAVPALAQEASPPAPAEVPAEAMPVADEMAQPVMDDAAWPVADEMAQPVVDEMGSPTAEAEPFMEPAEPTEMASPADAAADWAEAEAPAAPMDVMAEVPGEAAAVETLVPLTETLAPGAETGGMAMLPDEVAPPAAPAPGEPVLDTHPPLGAIGYDSEGRRGRIHIVVPGDTLWDISAAYLGTAWVWPSIWNDNGEIENPHLIYPGDRIWITPSEMRKISAEEAAAMLSNLPLEPAPPAAEDPAPIAPEPEPAPAMVAEPVERGSIRVSSREMAGLITPSQLEAAASIVGRVPERVFVSQEDDVFIGLGESDVEHGDQLTAFRTHEKVFDPDSRVLLGYHVEFLGWVEVKETFPETAKATIRMSTSELQEGDRLIPREPLPPEIPLQAGPSGVEGKISFFPQRRVVIGYNDFVYLNRGSVDGLEVGSPLDVYRLGYSADEVARGEEVLVPDFVIGRLVVVRTADESAVALVTSAKTELELGDRFRGSDE